MIFLKSLKTSWVRQILSFITILNKTKYKYVDHFTGSDKLKGVGENKMKYAIQI